jgi:hypothetical protein
MTVHSPDPSKLDYEQKELSKKERENEDRAKYMESLKISRKFQKYVVEEIFEKILEDKYSLDKIPMADDEKKVGMLTIQFKLAREGFKEVIDKLK